MNRQIINAQQIASFESNDDDRKRFEIWKIFMMQ